MRIDVFCQMIKVMDFNHLVSSSVGQYTSEIRFSPEWEGYDKFIAFASVNMADKIVSLVEPGQTTISIPWEILQKPGLIRIGAFGLRGTDARPTVWSEPIMVATGLNPKELTEITRPPTEIPWETLARWIGKLVDLKTESKESLVDAINEVYKLTSKGNYIALEKVKPYLRHVWYDMIDYKNAFAYFESGASPVNVGACSCVRNGSLIGRNFDWMYDENAEFVVETPAVANRYASIGIAGGLTELTDAFVDSGADSEAYKIVPFMLRDGMNEKGVFAEMNVIPTDYGYNRALPRYDSRVELPALMIVRYVLDYFASAQSAAEFLRDHATIYFPATLHDMHYELHFVIADADKTFLLEFIEGATVVLDITDDIPASTNFHRYGTTLNSDGTVYTPYTKDEDHDAMRTNGVTENGAGLERWNLIARGIADVTDMEGMRSLLNTLTYTRAYTITDPENVWYTEFVGDGLTSATPASEFAETVSAARSAYTGRTRGGEPATWHTVHSAIYDIAAKTLRVIVQEDGEEISYELKTG